MNTFSHYFTPNYYTAILCIIIFMLPYSIVLPNIFIILLVLLFLADIFLYKFSVPSNTSYRLILPFALLFLCYFASILYSTDMGEAFSTLEKRIPLLIFPSIILIIPLKKRNIEVIFYSFLISMALCCFAAFLLTFFYFAINPEEYYLEKALWYLPQTINFHAPYMALYLVVSNIICYYFYLLKKTQRIILAIFIINNIFLLLISSRTALVTNWIFIAGLSSYHLYNKKGKLITLVNLFAIAGVLYLSFLSVPYLHTKISKLTEAAYGVNQRVISGKAALEIIKENPLFGVGLGDVQEELNKSLPDSTYIDFNAHNQYLHELMTYGLVGFIFFAALFIIGYIKSVVHIDLPLFLFITAFLILFLTEVILDRYKGIMLFSLFYPLFLRINILSNKNSITSFNYNIKSELN